ncbi:hypothetical protein WOLCODRAFT_159928 [Wolfiporia cocos MD-104 SS10]|uniref:Uncharacterized protein n=1 Tax=Wolfiporia cocos (strain MD-104) TaxID=742152 RepID=A0A2H3J9A3_WOLCO|nr:hypothetical protein WOLCODRAFT_159928 [Wolfiporia cocos MD-104 SS10]
MSNFRDYIEERALDVVRPGIATILLSTKFGGMYLHAFRSRIRIRCADNARRSSAMLAELRVEMHKRASNSVMFPPFIVLSITASQFHFGLDMSSGTGSHILYPKPSLPSPSEEWIVYPRKPRAEASITPELASVGGYDNLLGIIPPFIMSEDDDDDIGYEAGCEGDPAAIARRRRIAFKRKLNYAARAAGISTSSVNFRRAKAYVASGIGRGIPSGVVRHTHRRTACIPINHHCKRAMAYATLGLGLPTRTTSQQARRPAYTRPIVDINTLPAHNTAPVVRPTLTRDAWAVAPSPSMLPTPVFTTPHITHFSVAPSPSMLPTPFPVYRMHVPYQPSSSPMRPIVRSSLHPIQRARRLPLATVGLGLGINLPITSSPMPESPLFFDYL